MLNHYGRYISSGIAIPVQQAGGTLGYVSWCSRTRERGDCSADNVATMHFLSHVFIRHVTDMVPSELVTGSLLTAREKQCLTLAALGIPDEELRAYVPMPETIGSVFAMLYYVRRSYEEGLAAFGYARERVAGMSGYAKTLYEGLYKYYNVRVKDLEVHAYAEQEHGDKRRHLPDIRQNDRNPRSRSVRKPDKRFGAAHDSEIDQQRVHNACAAFEHETPQDRRHHRRNGPRY